MSKHDYTTVFRDFLRFERDSFVTWGGVDGWRRFVNQRGQTPSYREESIG
ncbi:hypothetical protein KIV64_gp33 [Mycobacterium phage DroogsArmy]|uniref:Uncharacterized protein n=1 Tax=Mycobacterium phage DroogsArmy TaxID=2744011 RepID=A0A6N0A3X4_9CAUD|nr:hypothetical protein KIV64_gp33 [Mycobacterium phage DroogsArmy]QKO02455.1 hypothetical protein SEA_DROOGSARMY_59 [Mycobacterium phage DroogsArmy]